MLLPHTPSLCCFLIPSTSHPLTLSPRHSLPLLLPHTLTITLPHCVAPSHPHCYLCCSLTPSPSHSLVLLPHTLTITPSLCCSLTPSPSLPPCVAPSHPHHHSLLVLLPHTLTITLPPCVAPSLTITLSPCVAPSHPHHHTPSLYCSLTSSPSLPPCVAPSHPHHHSLLVLLPHTLTTTLPPCVAPSHPHHDTPSLCCSPVTLYDHNQGIAECTLCIHCFPYPLCMQASPNVLPSISLFSSSFLLIHISDFITSSLHPSQQDPWSLQCLYYIMKQLSLVGRGGSEGAVQWPDMMESVQQYAIYL